MTESFLSVLLALDSGAGFKIPPTSAP